MLNYQRVSNFFCLWIPFGLDTPQYREIPCPIFEHFNQTISCSLRCRLLQSTGHGSASAPIFLGQDGWVNVGYISMTRFPLYRHAHMTFAQCWWGAYPSSWEHLDPASSSKFGIILWRWKSRVSWWFHVEVPIGRGIQKARMGDG
jgi:hypothetical protein